MSAYLRNIFLRPWIAAVLCFSVLPLSGAGVADSLLVRADSLRKAYLFEESVRLYDQALSGTEDSLARIRIEDSKTYREETTNTIDNLKEEIKELSMRVDIKHKAIYSAYQCKLKSVDEECIVLSTFKKDCKECLAGKEQD